MTSGERAIARLEACTHPVSERYDVRAHPSIWGVRWCGGCGSVQLLEHGVPDPKWRAPVLLEIARQEAARAKAMPDAATEPPPGARGGGSDPPPAG